jgi:hypothetical protein
MGRRGMPMPEFLKRDLEKPCWGMMHIDISVTMDL